MAELVYGRHPVFHLISAGRRRPLRLHLLKGCEKAEPDLVRLSQVKKVPISLEEPSYFSKRFGREVTHQGVAVETEGYPYLEVESLLGEPLLLILDEIQDPQNLGALCRSAYLFGVGGVVIPENRAASVSPGACQASVGAVEYLKISMVSSVANTLELLKKNNFWIYGADPGGEKFLPEEAFPGKVAIVIGGEEKGLRRLVRERCDLRLKIPMVRPEIGSLNASVSGAVFLYELLRQKWQKT